MGRGRVFSREFKLAVVRQVAGGEKRPAQVCRKPGIAEGLLLRWRREYEARGEAAFASHQPSEALERRIADLERLCGQLALENAVPKKGVRQLPYAERRAMIAQAQRDHPELSVRRLCTLLGIGRSWYYERPEPSTRAERAVELRDAIEGFLLGVPGYGYRRVTKALAREGWAVNHKRVLGMMRRESLLFRLKRRFVATTDSAHALQTYPNLVASVEPTGPDQVWVADITYIRLPTSFVYLACVLDAWSRRCVGWCLSRSIDTQLTLRALDHALATRHPSLGLIHHSDRGVQYASADYVGRLVSAGARVSMAATGNPYENAKAERFFKTLKYEEVYLQQYRTFDEAEANLRRFIADGYTTTRLHSSLGYLPPAEFEAVELVRQGVSVAR